MKLVYFGSGEFGLPTLQGLIARHQVALVVTQPDRPAGRHQKLTPTPIGAYAAGAGLPILKSEEVNDAAVVAQVATCQAEAAVVIAFGQKLGPALIAAAGPVALNLHASLLPRYRGAAPINWAIINGERITGVSVIGLSQRMDAGLIYGQTATEIGPRETAGELHDRLAQMGPDLVLRVLRDFSAGTLRGREQDEALATRAPKLSRADGGVNFGADARTVAARVHGLTPWPGVAVQWLRRIGPAVGGAGGPTGGAASAVTAQDGPWAKAQPLILRRVEPAELTAPLGLAGSPPQTVDGPGAASLPVGLVLPGSRIVVGDGAVQLLEVQIPGGRPMGIEEFVRGHPLRPGDRLMGGSPAPPTGE